MKRMTGWTKLTGTCEVCNERADFRIDYVDNSSKFSHSIKEFCQAHAPKELVEDIKSWHKTIQTPPGA